MGALICALLWGSAFPAIKYAYRLMGEHSLGDRIAFAGVRFTLAGIVLLLFVKSPLARFREAPVGRLLWIALAQTVLQYLFFYWGLSLVTGVLAAIIIATGSFWWVFFAPLFNKNDTITSRQFMALVLGFAGVCIAVWQPGGGEGRTSLFGVGLLVCASVCGAVAALMARQIKGQAPTALVTGFALFCGGSVLIGSSAFRLIPLWEQAGPALIPITLYLVFVSAAAFSLWYFLVTIYDVAELSGYRFFIPVAGVIESALLIPGEQVGWTVFAGGFVVLLSVRLLEKLK